MPLTLEQAIARVPFLAHAQDLHMLPLTGGITNLNYRIDADGKSYVLRITGTGTELLGIRRVAEKIRTFHQQAAPLAGEFNVFRRVEMLTAISRRNNCQFPANFLDEDFQG
jgi:Ser/Thr protein kinase RdoA (MazF antagonist)